MRGWKAPALHVQAPTDELVEIAIPHLVAGRLSLKNTDLTRNTSAPHFTPQHWLLCHMGLYKYELEFLLSSFTHSLNHPFTHSAAVSGHRHFLRSRPQTKRQASLALSARVPSFERDRPSKPKPNA